MTMELTESEIQRYSRHIILQDVGGKGQLCARAVTQLHDASATGLAGAAAGAR